jgi:hypothetical protein
MHHTASGALFGLPSLHTDEAGLAIASQVFGPRLAVGQVGASKSIPVLIAQDPEFPLGRVLSTGNATSLTYVAGAAGGIVTVGVVEESVALGLRRKGMSSRARVEQLFRTTPIR